MKNRMALKMTYSPKGHLDFCLQTFNDVEMLGANKDPNLTLKNIESLPIKVM